MLCVTWLVSDGDMLYQVCHLASLMVTCCIRCVTWPESDGDMLYQVCHLATV